MLLLNAFSLSMIQSLPASVLVVPTDDPAALLAPGFASAVGHADTAKVFESILGLPVPVNRANVQLAPGDEALVGQYIGPRLPEGATTLPEGASIKWMLVRIA